MRSIAGQMRNFFCRVPVSVSGLGKVNVLVVSSYPATISGTMENDHQSEGKDRNPWGAYIVHGGGKECGSKDVQCRFCGKQFHKMPSTKGYAHIMGTKVLGMKRLDVSVCIPIQTRDDAGTILEDRRPALLEMRKEFAEHLKVKEDNLNDRKRKQAVLDDLALATPSATKGDSAQHPKCSKDNLDESVGQFFYENGVPFYIAQSASWKEMIQTAIRFGKDNPSKEYKEPNRWRIAGPLLDAARDKTEERLQKHVEARLLYGCTVASDGWSDAQQRPIINFMVITREAAVFSKSIDCSDHMAEGGRKDAQYLAEAIISEIKSVGPENVIQVIMDGANKAVWPFIQKEFPHITCAWCCAHVLDLLLEDIGKMEFFSALWEQGKNVVKWIRSHQHFRALLAKKSQKLLLLPGKYCSSRKEQLSTD